MTDDRPLHIVVLRAKRYVKARRNPDGSYEVVDWTLHGLSGGVVPPAAMPGRDSERRPNWTRPVAEHALVRALAGGTPLVFDAPWDDEDDERWPHLRRVQLATADALASMPAVLGCHAFTWVLEAVVDKELSPAVGTLWTLDPGGNNVQWKSLQWFDSAGREHPVTTRNDDLSAVRLERLADKGWRWSVPVPYEDPGLVDILLVRRVGRGGALIDAQLADPTARAIDHEVVYSEGDASSFVRDEVKRLGPTGFFAHYGVPVDTADKISAGRRPSPATIRRVLAALGTTELSRTCILADCEAPVTRRNQQYCSAAHREKAYRERQKSLRRSVPGPVGDLDPHEDDDVVCPSCGTYLVGFASGELCDECKESDVA